MCENQDVKKGCETVCRMCGAKLVLGKGVFPIHDHLFCSEKCIGAYEEKWGEYIIDCDKCDNTEGMPLGEQRWHSQSFDWIENIDEGDEATALYKCNKCGNWVKSAFVVEEDCDREEINKDD